MAMRNVTHPHPVDEDPGPPALFGWDPHSGEELVLSWGWFDGEPALALFIGDSGPVLLPRDLVEEAVCCSEPDPSPVRGGRGGT